MHEVQGVKYVLQHMYINNAHAQTYCRSTIFKALT